MTKQKKLIPELRFPEFAKSEEWEVKTLGEICDYWNGGSHESGVDENGKYFLISLNSIDIEGKLKSEMKRISYTDNSLQKDDLIMVLSDVAHGNFLGLTDIIPNDKYVLNQRMAGLRIKKTAYANPLFIRTFINYNQKYFKSNGQGSSQLNLSKSAITDFPIQFPSIQEQQKIASCLSSLDEVITAHSQKLELLKNHKKGLMQNLFPQENEKVPKLRFKEFKGDWAEKPIKQVFSIFQGYAFASNDNASDGTRWLKIADVGIQEMKNDTPSFLPIEFKEEYKRFLVNKGDYVLALTRPILNMKLKIARIDETFNNSLLNQRVGKIVTSNDSSFIYYLLQTTKMVENINKNIAGNEPPNLSFQQIEDIEIFLPPTIEEQQKIASCLSSLDELITAQTEKIEQLKQHKKGLMQGLFPKMND